MITDRRQLHRTSNAAGGASLPAPATILKSIGGPDGQHNAYLVTFGDQETPADRRAANDWSPVDLVRYASSWP